MRAIIRLLLRRPGYSLLAILTLAIGLGVNAVAFSLVNALLFRASRIAGDSNIGWLYVGTRTQAWPEASFAAYERIRADARTLDSIVAEGRMPLAYDSGTQTEQIWALVVSPDYFATVRVPLTTGRAWRADEAATRDVPVMISEHFWRTRLGAATDLPALSLTLNRQRTYIVGVVDDDFEDPGGVYAPDVFVPLTAAAALRFPASRGDGTSRWLTLLAKPRAGATADAIVADVTPIAKDVAVSRGEAGDDVRVSFAFIANGNPSIRPLWRAARIGLTAVGAVLLIACFNVAGLLLARSVERQRELGIRAALGAGRRRLVSQILGENLCLAALGAAAALFVAAWSGRLLAIFSLPAPIPERLNFPTDWRLLAYTACLAIASAVVPALAPAWQVWRSDSARWLRGGAIAGAPQARVRRGFVVVQAAGSTLLLTLALLFGRSFVNALTVDTGFDVERTALLEIDPGHYGYTPERAERLAERLREALARRPDVRAVSVAERLPFFIGPNTTRSLSLDGRDCSVTRCVDATTYAVDDHFFETVAIPIRRGRAFDVRDAREAIVVSETAAAQLWPDRDTVGQTVFDGSRRLHVVGVAADVAQRSFSERPPRHFYRRMTDFGGGLKVIVRGAGRPETLIAPMREAVRTIDPDLPVQSARTMTDWLALPRWLPRVMAGFFGICGVLAVFLAGTGLFGVTYYLVLQRSREFGIRTAVGASTTDLRRLVVGESVRLVVPGILVGIAGAIAGGMAARSLLFGVSTATPATYAAAALLQIAVAIAASWLPARRAARVDPLKVLRAE